MMVVFALTFVAATARAGGPDVFVEALGGVHDLQVARVMSRGDTDEVHALAAAIPIFSGGVALGIGGDPAPRRFGAMAVAHYELGSTSYGLRSHIIFLGGEVHYRLDTSTSFFFGGRAGELIVERATEGSAISHWGFGANAGVLIDLAQWAGGRLFFRPELDAMIIPHTLFHFRTLLWGGSVGIGYRF